jgi:hypothetical protein
MRERSPFGPFERVQLAVRVVCTVHQDGGLEWRRAQMRLQHCHHHPAWHKNARSDRGCFPVLTGNTQTASAVPPPPKSIRSQSDRIPCSVSLYLITRARSNPKLKLEADMSHHQHPNPMLTAEQLHNIRRPTRQQEHSGCPPIPTATNV